MDTLRVFYHIDVGNRRSYNIVRIRVCLDFLLHLYMDLHPMHNVGLII